MYTHIYPWSPPPDAQAREPRPEPQPEVPFDSQAPV